MYNSEKNLFKNEYLSDYLSSLNYSLKKEIDKLKLDDLTQKNALIDKLMNSYSLKTPVIKDGDIKIDPHETTIEINTGDSSLGFYHEPIFVKGLSIKVELDFQGNSYLFRCRPSTYSLSGTPNAEINDKKIIFNYETTEKNPDKIKNLWLHDIKEIKQNLEWMEKDISQYNDSLKSTIETMIKNREKELEEINSLINKLKN